MEKKIKIGDKEITIRELKYLEILEIEEIREKNIKESITKLFLLSTGLSEEDVKDLSFKDGLRLQKSINEVNGLEDFQIPVGGEN